MTEPIHICTDESCSTAGQGPSLGFTSTEQTKALTIDVVSDVICPWCWIGKRRLEKALKLLGDPVGVEVHWKPFQLNPQMPPSGMERRAYRTAKFGSWERSQSLDAQVAAAGDEEGITFKFERMTRTPNTLYAHRLIWRAGSLGVQDAVAERLFRGYFEEGMDLNNHAALVRLAVEGGISAPDAQRLLAGDEGKAEVLREEAHYKSHGVRGVPTFFFNGEPGFSGAVSPPMLADAIRQAMTSP